LKIKKLFAKEWISISVMAFVMIIILFFQYPLMISYQNSDESIEPNSFGITTARGENYHARDTTVFGNDIISLYKNPGLLLRDTITYEHQNELIPAQGTATYVMHSFLYLLFGNITLTLVVGSILSTLLIIIILYYIARLIQRNYKLKYSNLRSFFLVVCFLTFPTVIFDILRFIFSEPRLLYPYIGYVGRLININHIAIFLLLWFFVLIYVLFNNKQDKKLLILIGVLLATFQYSYVYFYTAALVFTGLAFLIKYNINKNTIIKLFWIYSSWLVLSIPYLINFFSKDEFGDEFIIRAGATFSNFISFTNELIILFIICSLFFLVNYFYNKKKKGVLKKSLKDSYLSISLFITGFVMLNIQYIIGYTVQPYHWIAAFIIPMVILIFFIQFNKLLVIIKKHTTAKKAINILVGLFIIVSLFGAVLHLSISANQWYKYYYFDDSESGLFEFIKNKTEENSVFFADTSYTNDLISVNTERKVLLGNMFHTRSSTAETHQRLIFGYNKLELSKKTLINDINQSSESDTHLKKIMNLEIDDPYANWNNMHLYYHTTYRGDRYGSGEYNDTGLIEDILEAYDFPKQEFKLDYVIYSRDVDKHSNVQGVVYKNKKFVVKKV